MNTPMPTHPGRTPEVAAERVWFQTRSADFPVGLALPAQPTPGSFPRPAGWKARNTADKNVCATGSPDADMGQSLPFGTVPGCLNDRRQDSRSRMEGCEIRRAGRPALRQAGRLPLRPWPFAFCSLLALLLLGGLSAPAQSRVPGPNDYEGFSRFIADRNIFDPTRVPHRTGRHPVVVKTRDKRQPSFSFVGAMEYQKGLFAFFDGNRGDYRLILQVSGKVAGYTVRQIALGAVKLEDADGKTLDLEVGHQMQQNRDGVWELAGFSEGFSSPSADAPPAPITDVGGSADSPAAPAGSQNDILKKLMLQRQQENK
jgi:hypothetical protein